MAQYYDIDAILTDAQVLNTPCLHRADTNYPDQKVPSTFEITVPNLGYLDGNPGGAVRLIPQTHFALPEWISF
jgi:hypothetical protein